LAPSGSDLFTTESLAVMAILDLAGKPLGLEPWLEWIEALLIEDGDGEINRLDMR